MNNKERFKALCLSTNREGILELLNWLEDSDFYSAPASTRFHGAYQGGLLQHSLNVYEELNRLLSIYNFNIAKDSIVITSLLHDLCKVNLYSTEKRNRKNSDGKWESYDCYTYDEKFCFGGHGSKSVFLLQNFIKLLPEEAVAINCHMGAWEEGMSKSVGSAYEQFPLAWLLHVADEAATFILEKE